MPKLKVALIFIGDIVFLYSALILTLLVRYGADYFWFSFSNHFLPFSLIFIVWLSVFYLFDLYQIKSFKNKYILLKNLLPAIVFSVIVSIILFYLFGKFFELTPKTNLAIFTFIFGVLNYGWRLLLIKFFTIRGWRINLIIVGDSEIIENTFLDLKNNPLLGYKVVFWIKNLKEIKLEELKRLILENKVEKIIISANSKKEDFFFETAYRLLFLGVEIIDFADFYESIYQKTPLEEIENSKVAEQIKIQGRFFDLAKRITEIVLALLLLIVFLPIILISALLIKISSPRESVFFKQERMGKNNKPFILYKLRTMRSGAGKEEPLWTEENDKRITKPGKILRRLYLDELPQLYNILKGELSFIGPRAERTELVGLYEQLPYYNLRHLIKPGVSGWAQLNYKPSASLEEAFEKLKYDIYYLKNRSLILDLIIFFKTIRLFF